MKKKVSYVDWENRIIVGKSGKVYNIAPEKTASKLWAQYQIRASLLALNSSLDSLVTRIKSSIDHLRNGNQNAQGNASNAIIELESIFKGFRNYIDNDQNAVLEFLSIFCKTSTEEVDVNDDSTIRMQADDWSEIPQADLFFLSQISIPSYKKHLTELMEQSNQKNPKEANKE